MGLSSAMDTDSYMYSVIYIMVNFWIMEDNMRILFTIIILILGFITWAIFKVAGDSDKRGGQK